MTLWFVDVLVDSGPRLPPRVPALPCRFCRRLVQGVVRVRERGAEHVLRRRKRDALFGG